MFYPPHTLIYTLENHENSVVIRFPITDWFVFQNAPFLAPSKVGVMFRHELNGAPWWGYFRGCDPNKTCIQEPNCPKTGREGREMPMHAFSFGPESQGPVRDALALSFARGHMKADAVLAQAKADYAS